MVCPHSAAAAVGGGGACQAALAQLQNQQVHAPLTSVLGFGVLGFFFFFFCCVKEASRKLDPFSHRLTHTLWDKSWTPTPERGLRPAGPELQAPEENQMLPTRRELTLPARSGSPPPVVLTCHHCFLSQKRYLFLVLLFSFD